MVEHQNKVASRYELRYFVPHGLASQVRDFVCEYMELDQYGADYAGFAYPVHTIYLDSDDWKIYWNTVRGDQTRLKLRFRYYSGLPDAPVYLEVKRQRTDEISKQRCQVRRDAVDGILSGFMPSAEQMSSRDPQDWQAAEQFVDLLAEMEAKPKLHVACFREAYVSCEQSARITIDSQIRVGHVSEDVLTTRMENPVASLEKVLVLELRFTDCYPAWYGDLVDSFNLSLPCLVPSAQPTFPHPGLPAPPDDLIYNVVF